MSSLPKTFCIVLVAIALTPVQAWAYLDGGSAALLTQLIIGFIAGAGAWLAFKINAVRAWWSARFGSGPRDDSNETDEKPS